MSREKTSEGVDIKTPHDGEAVQAAMKAQHISIEACAAYFNLPVPTFERMLHLGNWTATDLLRMGLLLNTDLLKPYGKAFQKEKAARKRSKKIDQSTIKEGGGQ